MVGIVIVSHSSKISEGVVELSSQMAGDVKVLSAGGTDDGRIGTDAIKIKESIEKANDGDGVLVFADLGSAVMNAQLAIDMLDEDLQKKVLIANGPIVEGAVVAAVQASIGNNLEEVKQSAEESKNMNKI
ncbi:dihydroxyacetone kinase phosphoryl donor subunit DhaM [Anaerosalibacter massiliensis]|uniref:phosphoenolpyruvate--glycerone phosphotransferase n=1 Tax=Anaerosalibacter massiliensis TaxID=1347392 RepID=A0A9X2S6Z8_9FIRM|nr:dihydroxyacetone kinase phosphoryl donor subunit DhaM [Anaerosalibacter massiliensis]MCR2044222.1 dihydroxyacetone kinase phosphoryl donor subunit DhaM [Anaerosalibacter massiliensis]